MILWLSDLPQYYQVSSAAVHMLIQLIPEGQHGSVDCERKLGGLIPPAKPIGSGDEYCPLSAS
ncbi:hypothetical protein PPNK14_34750 [Pectobacterium parmentieri]|nr:hypothetical protein PB20LOC_04323 [Pectobacterium parmentieri]